MEETCLFSSHWIPWWCELDSSLGVTSKGPNNGSTNIFIIYFHPFFLHQLYIYQLQILRKAIYSSIKSNLIRRTCMQRLHIYPGSEIPEDIKGNISGQIKPLKPIPKPLQEYSQKEIDSYPKVFDYPEDYIVR